MESNYEEVYAKYFPKVYLYIFTICHDEHIAEEVTQEAFFKALKNISSFKGECKLQTWLCQIAKNTLYDFYKKENRQVSIENYSNELISDIDLIIAFEQNNQIIKVHECLHHLEEPYKEVFTLRIFAELSFKQIGELFNKTDGWARVVFYRAKKKLLEELK
ncbi:RNA polymerase sigma factor [Peptococcus simiae]|uniref:RNA polymerase sigma factor n=1 Tax=Peptococcus simiae TaxID=1643805 RepID=A0ABW9H0J5_9FIRM